MIIKFGYLIKIDRYDYVYCGKYDGKRLLYLPHNHKYLLVNDNFVVGKSVSILETGINYKMIADVNRKIYERTH